MKHSEFTARPKESAAIFRCSAERCGKTLDATLRARLERSTCRAEEARRCTDHPDAMPLAWTHSRSTCLALLEQCHAEKGNLNSFLLGYARESKKYAITYPGTTLDGLREMLHWGQHWAMLPTKIGLGT